MLQKTLFLFFRFFLFLVSWFPYKFFYI